MLIGKKLRGFQLGVEPTQGTLVAANRNIPNGIFKAGRKNNISKATSEGHRSAIGVQRGKRWDEFSISGQLGYNILAYIGAGIFDATGGTPATLGSGVYGYTQTENVANLHTPQTYSFEYGNSLGSNSRFPFGTLSDFTLRLNATTCVYELSGFGVYPTKNITITTSPTFIKPVLMNYNDCRLSYSTTFGGISTGKLLTGREIELSIKTKYKAQFFIDDATNSLGGIVELQGQNTGSITVAEGTESDQFLNSLEQSQQGYLQFKATGPLLLAGTPNLYNSFTYTWSVDMDSEEETDDDDLFSGKYMFYTAEDSTNNDINFSVVNGLATL